MRILGREPALWLSVLGAAVTILVSMNLSFLNAGQGAAIVAAATAILMAITTRPVAPALFTGVLAAGVALMSEYGLHLSDMTVGGLTALVLSVFALVSRGQISPQETVVSSK